MGDGSRGGHKVTESGDRCQTEVNQRVYWRYGAKKHFSFLAFLLFTLEGITMKSTRKVLNYFLFHLLVRLHPLLICLLCTAAFARALRCVHLFSHSVALSQSHAGFVHHMNASITYSFNPLWPVLSSVFFPVVRHK